MYFPVPLWGTMQSLLNRFSSWEGVLLVAPFLWDWMTGWKFWEGKMHPKPLCPFFWPRFQEFILSEQQSIVPLSLEQFHNWDKEYNLVLTLYKPTETLQIQIYTCIPSKSNWTEISPHDFYNSFRAYTYWWKEVLAVYCMMYL